MKITVLTAVLSLLLHLSAASETTRTYHDGIRHLKDTMSTVEFPDGTLRSIALESRISVPGHNTSFSILWNISPDNSSFYSATIKPSEGRSDELLDDRYIEFTVCHVTPEGTELLHSSRLKEGFGMDDAENTLGVEISTDSAIVRVYGGEEMPRLLFERRMPDIHSSKMGVASEGESDIRLLVSEYERDDREKLRTSWTGEKLMRHLEKSSFPEGIYRYLDRENDPRYARPGGSYTLALVKNAENGYDLIYLSGAQTNSGEWETGMVKGRLKPTIFAGHYDLVWYDATKKELSSECSADIEQAAILRLNFPLLKSSMRFSLLPQDKK